VAGDAPDFASFESACEGYARELLAEVVTRGGTAGLNTRTTVEYGDPAEAILGAAAAEDVDLLIMGARDRGPLARMLLGSVSSDLIARCPKPVMVVPERSLSAEEPREPAPQA
jgi:nucleotide-binding universal stress UspA family protein